MKWEENVAQDYSWIKLDNVQCLMQGDCLQILFIIVFQSLW